MTKRAGMTAAGAAVVLLVFGGVLWLVSSPGGSRHSHQRPRSLNALNDIRASPVTTGMTDFRDVALGISISYPSSWSRLAPADPQVPLLVSSPGGAEALLVRVTPLGLAVHDVTLRELPALRPLTDRLVRSDRRAHLLQPPAEVQIGGLFGYAYVYTEAGTARGGRMAHVQYFLFSGPTLIALVFQVAQASRLTAAARSFARIAETFKVTTATG